MPTRTLAQTVSIVATVVLAGCAAQPTLPYPQARKDDLSTKVIHLSEPHYAAERQYILQRDQAVRLAGGEAAKFKAMLDKTTRPSGAIGLALSGGGLRSATLNLGVLQGLQQERALQSVDYLSAVSGGSYIAAWFTSHLVAPEHGPSTEFTDERKMKSYVADADKLLGVGSFSVPQEGMMVPGRTEPQQELFNERHFVYGAFYSKVPMRLALWAARYPAHLVFDVLLHFKPNRGKFNLHHPIYLYRRAIRDTYLQAYHRDAKGKLRATRLVELNQPHDQSPYLIINAAMRNGAQQHERRDPFAPCAEKTTAWEHNLFEFTRDFCGSEETGFIDTKYFNQRVARVAHAPGSESAVQTVLDPKIAHRVADAENLGTRLDVAVAASGAAVDSGVGPSAIGAVKTLLNANLRFQTYNFSQTYSRVPEDALVDRLREVTTDRVKPSLGSNTLYLSDGAHYEGFGVVSLVRRRAGVIVVVDALADPKYRYGDLRQAMRSVAREQCEKCGRSLEWKFDHSDEKGVPRFVVGSKERPRLDGNVGTWNSPIQKGWIQCPLHHYRARTIYCKASYQPQYAKPLVLPGGKLRQDVRAAESVADYGRRASFPHISTLQQQFTGRTFEAYRLLGYYLGRRLIVEALNTPESAQAPNPQAKTL